MGNFICLTIENWGESPASGRTERKLLRLALFTAVAVHLLAITAFTFAPSWRANGLDLEQINVFDNAPVSFAQPVEMVNLHELQAPPEASTTVVLPSPAAPRLTAKPNPTRVVVPIVRPTPRVNPRPSPGRTAPAGSRRPERPASGAAQPAPSGGGGGGSPVRVLTGAAPGGGFTVGPAGNTPAGQLPGSGTGVGAGSGSGTGPGTGSGSGGGSGSGTGAGQGSGSSAGSGSGSGGGGSGGGFVSRQADRSEPQVIHRGTLSYPASAAEEGVEGKIDLKVLVDEAGRVATVEVTSSSGDGRLDAAAIDWVSGWRYLPAVQDGRPRRVWTKAKVTFRLE